MKFFIERPSYYHVSLYTLQALVKHLELIGFKVEETVGLLSPWIYKNKLIRLFSSFLLKPSLAPIILVVARKPLGKSHEEACMLSRYEDSASSF